NQLRDQFRKLHFFFRRRAVCKSQITGLFYFLNNSGISVSKNPGTPGTDIINVFISVCIPDSAASGGSDKPWRPSDRLESSDRAVDASRNMLFCTLKQFF